jgi:diadenylate cyclase
MGTGNEALSALEHFRLLHFGWRDLLEIAIVSYVLYRALLLFQRTRAVRILLGLVVLVTIYGMAYVLKFGMITYLMSLVFQYGAIALLIVFHPELRAGLAHLGRTRRFFPQLGDEAVADEIANAAERLSRLGIGAIIAVERQFRLDEFVVTGAEMQARVSADLLVTIFTPHSPLHDGAVIIRGDTIIGAGCILPLSQAETLDRSLATRHRAALGLAEQSDAVIVVVSEETSSISMAANGALWRNLSRDELKERFIGRLARSAEPAPVGLSA